MGNSGRRPLDNEAAGLVGLALFLDRQGMVYEANKLVDVFDAWRDGVRFQLILGKEHKQVRLTLRAVEGDGCRDKDTAVNVEIPSSEDAWKIDFHLTQLCNERLREVIGKLGKKAPDGEKRWLLDADLSTTPDSYK